MLFGNLTEESLKESTREYLEKCDQAIKDLLKDNLIILIIGEEG